MQHRLCQVPPCPPAADTHRRAHTPHTRARTHRHAQTSAAHRSSSACLCLPCPPVWLAGACWCALCAGHDGGACGRGPPLGRAVTQLREAGCVCVGAGACAAARESSRCVLACGRAVTAPAWAGLSAVDAPAAAAATQPRAGAALDARSTASAAHHQARGTVVRGACVVARGLLLSSNSSGSGVAAKQAGGAALKAVPGG